MVEATNEGRVFGADVIFTFGPLHQALTGQASREWTPFLLGRVLFSLGWFAIVLLSGRLFGVKVALAVALAVSLTPFTEVYFYLLAFLGVVLGFKLQSGTGEGGRAALLLAVSLASLCALATLVKLSFVGAATPALLVLLGLPALRVLLRRERVSLHTTVLFLAPVALTLLAWGITVNWSPRALLNYFLGLNLDIVKGYSGAMAYPPSGPAWTLVGLYILFAAYSAGLFWKLQARGDPQGTTFAGRFPLGSLLSLGALALLYWVLLKSSFVRGDPWHTRTATFWGLGALLVLLALPSSHLHAFLRGQSRAIGSTILLLPFVLGALLLPSTEEPLGVRWIKHRLLGAVENLPLLTSAGRQAATASRDATLARIRERTEDFGIPRGTTADIFPWDITRLLANGLQYTPRPIPQSYSVYTPALQRANRDFILSAKNRPEYLIIMVKEIDDRLPISLDSPLLLHLRREYEFHHRGNQGALVFRRREEGSPAFTPRKETVASGLLTWSQKYRYIWSSTPISIPGNLSGPLVLSAHFQGGPSRTLLATLYRPFPVLIEYLDHSGNVVQRARFITEAAEEMIVYPIVHTNAQLMEVLYPAPGTPQPSAKTGIASLRFTVTDFGTPFTDTEFKLEAYDFNAPAPLLRSRALGPMESPTR